MYDGVLRVFRTFSEYILLNSFSPTWNLTRRAEPIFIINVPPKNHLVALSVVPVNFAVTDVLTGITRLSRSNIVIILLLFTGGFWR